MAFLGNLDTFHLSHQVDARLKDLRSQLKDLTQAYAKSEDDLKVPCSSTSSTSLIPCTSAPPTAPPPPPPAPPHAPPPQALQSVGQIVGEVLRQLTEEKFIVKVGFVLLSKVDLFCLCISNNSYRRPTGRAMWWVAGGS